MAETKKIKAIHNTECLCWKCIKEHDKSKIHIIEIGALGYNSCFDNLSTRIQLCDDCYNVNPEWWNLETIIPEGFEQFGYMYKYDKEICQFINELPLESQELAWNEYAYGACAGYNMDAQDWIDYQLGIISHEKCKEYGMYSPDEEKAYEERFPTCQHPIEIDYRDSIGCHCPFGAFGKSEDGVVFAEDDMLNDCYGCEYYKKRTVPIIRIKSEDEADYNLYVEYQLNKDRLKQKFGEMLKGVV